MLASQTIPPEINFLPSRVVSAFSLQSQSTEYFFCAPSLRLNRQAIDVACCMSALDFSPDSANGTFGDVQNSNRAQIRLPFQHYDRFVRLLEAKTVLIAASPTIRTPQ